MFKYKMKALTLGGNLEVSAYQDTNGIVKARYFDKSGFWFREYENIEKFKSFINGACIKKIIAISETNLKGEMKNV